METIGLFQFGITFYVIKARSASFEYLYVLGLRQLNFFHSYSAGIDFKRQNLTTMKSILALNAKYNWCYIGIDNWIWTKI